MYGRVFYILMRFTRFQSRHRKCIPDKQIEKNFVLFSNTGDTTFAKQKINGFAQDHPVFAVVLEKLQMIGQNLGSELELEATNVCIAIELLYLFFFLDFARKY